MWMRSSRLGKLFEFFGKYEDNVKNKGNAMNRFAKTNGHRHYSKFRFDMTEPEQIRRATKRHSINQMNEHQPQIEGETFCFRQTSDREALKME